MKKKIFLLVLGCAATLMVSACGNKTENLKKGNVKQQAGIEEEKSAGLSVPEEYKDKKENVVFNTQLHIDESAREKGISKETAIRQKYDIDKVYQKLFAGVGVQDEIATELTAYDGTNMTEHYYEGDNEEILCVSPERVMYRRSLYNYVFNCVDTSAGGNLASYAQDMDFPFATREEALKNIVAELEEMGISLGETEYQVYALDYKTMQQNEYAENHDGNEDRSVYKDKWSEEDNCYYFFIRQKAGNLPEYHAYSGIFKNPIAENLPVKVVYSKNGIESLELEAVYEFEETKGDEVTLASFEDIAETTAYKYNQLLTNAEYTVTDATLYYMTENAGDGTYRMLPVWILNVEEKAEVDGEVTTDSLLVFVDAQTGEEIAMEDKY